MPQWARNQVIYELNIRQFSDAGTFAAVEADLGRLSDLGINTIWLMPVQPYGEVNRKGELGSYYSIRDYTGINPEYGSVEDFRSLVNAAHKRGMHVILDWVANHTSWDNPLTVEHPEYYAKDGAGNFTPPTGTDWTDVIQLDFSQPGLLDYQVNAMKYWLDEFGIDGFRCDVAWGVPTPFWNELSAALRAHKPNLFMLAESEMGDQQLKAFNASYGWGLLHTFEEIAQGREQAISIDAALARRQLNFPAGATFLNMTSNHDENSWNGTVFERFGGGARTFAVLSMTMDGMPLLYNGQEVGLDKRLLFFVRDPIQWHESPFTDFYKTLIALKSRSPALLTGAPTEKVPNTEEGAIYSFIRGKAGEAEVLVIANLTAKDVTVELGSSRMAGSWTDVFSGEAKELSESEKMTLKSWDFKLMSR